MSKRVTLTNREISYIIAGLKVLQAQCNLDYQVIKAGKAVYQDIIDKLDTKKAENSNGQ